MSCKNHQFFSIISVQVYGLLLLCLATITGCAVGPDYRPVHISVPESYAGPVAGGMSSTPDEIRWWTAFDDPMLSSLVERAIYSNLDMKLAASRIRQARAARNIALAGFGPSVNAGGSFQRSQSPLGSFGSSTGGNDGVTSSQFQAGFDAAWELDIFGGVRRSVEAADADLLATVEESRGIFVTLAAEVAVNTIDLRAFQQRTLIARQNLRAQRHNAELTRKRFIGGFIGGLDVANADAQAATTAAEIPLLEASAAQAIYRLSLLIGREPGALILELSEASAIPVASPLVPVGAPSQLLRRRPDIRKAEAEIHAATARIGVVTADLFPKVTLYGSAGFQNREFSSWMDWSNRFWSFGPSVSWQVFNTGRTLSNIELMEAFQEQTMISYQQTVLSALQEVDNALIASQKEQERRNSLEDAVAASRKSVQIATRLYTLGHTDFLNVLLAQRSQYASEEALAQSTRTVSTNLIALYKALGGGWEVVLSEPDETPARSFLMDE